MNFNDMIEVLMENFVKPYREGRLSYVARKHKRKTDKKVKKDDQSEVIDIEDEGEELTVKSEQDKGNVEVVAVSGNEDQEDGSNS